MWSGLYRSSGSRGHGGQLWDRYSVIPRGDAPSGGKCMTSDKEALVGQRSVLSRTVWSAVTCMPQRGAVRHAPHVVAARDRARPAPHHTDRHDCQGDTSDCGSGGKSQRTLTCRAGRVSEVLAARCWEMPAADATGQRQCRRLQVLRPREIAHSRSPCPGLRIAFPTPALRRLALTGHHCPSLAAEPPRDRRGLDQMARTRRFHRSCFRPRWWTAPGVQCKTPAGQSDTLVDIVVAVNDTHWDLGKSFDVIDKKVAATGFQYQMSTFSGISPNYGPRAGGTSIALHGTNLDSGASQTVSVGSHPCHIYRCGVSHAPAAYPSEGPQCKSHAKPPRTERRPDRDPIKPPEPWPTPGIRILTTKDQANKEDDDGQPVGDPGRFCRQPQTFRRREGQPEFVRTEHPTPRKTDVWRTADRRPLCYHCGEADHIYRSCPYRRLGLRGFHPNDPRPSVTNLTILCSTNRLEGSHPGGDEAHRVTLMIDGQEVPYLPTEGLTATFSYKPNPVVNKIVPASAPFKGRSKILVLGKNLDSVAKPVMVIRVTSLNYRHHENISKECVPADDSHSLACPVASLFDSSVIPRNELQNHRDAIRVHVHFQMDGLRLPERAASMDDSFKFVYRPPPKFDPFPPGGLNVLANDPTVLIRGHNFEVLEHDDEFSVKIDDVDNACKVINITSTTIGCVYNIYEESDDAAHTVDVVMGNETFRLGTLKLVSGQASCHTDTISGVVIAVFVLTSIVVGSFFYYKRRQPNKRTPGYLSNYVRGNEADARQALIASSFQLDNKTKAMLEAEKLLFKRDFLTLGPVIGQDGKEIKLID
ncbi:hypothetical protein HPB47_011263 [Ixodes persulcatus]|uniref:Uncharacterized protein n=1 Tax=Ixodes persulcatus TaxID=34615 RepID=A0AC60NWQ7_IXOPE|nr:hypothetical protein HPB47_011263 [Ixodes persulcatus]